MEYYINAQIFQYFVAKSLASITAWHFLSTE